MLECKIFHGTVGLSGRAQRSYFCIMTVLVVSLPEANLVCWEQFEVGGFVTARI